MPWYASVYLVALLVLLGAGLRVDFRARKPWWYLAGELLEGLILVWFVCSFYHDALFEMAGVWVGALLLCAGVWDTWTLRRDLAEMEPVEEMTEEEQRHCRRAAVALGVATIAPAYLFGFLSYWRAMAPAGVA